MGPSTFRRELPAILGGHDALELLDDHGGRTAVILEGLRAVNHLDASFAAEELVVRGLVGILEPTPSANIQHQDGIELSIRSEGIGEERLQALALLERQAAHARIEIAPVDLIAARLGVLSND